MCLPQSPPPHLLPGNVKLLGTAALSSPNGTRHPPVQARQSVFCPFRDPHPRCSGQGSFPLTCCQTCGSPRLAPARSLSSPRPRSAVDSPHPAGCSRRALPRCSPPPPPPPPLPPSRDTHSPASATGDHIRPRELSKAVPGDCRFQRGCGPAPGSPTRTHLAGRRHLAAPPVT